MKHPAVFQYKCLSPTPRHDLCSKFLRTGRAIIKSFHAGSVGGIDIACPQHILDMTTSIETVTALFIIASKFVITLPRGNHRDIISIFSMKVSLSLEKISGMRPKTFGYILAAWWPSGLVTRHSALWSRVRIPVAVGEICDHNWSSFPQLSDHAVVVSSGYSRFLHQEKSCRGQNSKMVTSWGGRLFAHLLSLHNRAGVAGSRSALTSHRLK